MYMIGKIDPIWDMQEVKNLSYFTEPFNDPDTVSEWHRIYGQSFTIGEQADYRVIQPSCQSVLEDQFSVLGLKNFGFSWYRMWPGDLIPRHTDTYVSYCRYWKVDPKKVIRILVMLEDWKPGHLLEIEQQSISGYTAGTFAYWTYGTLHMAGNVGSDTRYSLQITATCS